MSLDMASLDRGSSGASDLPESHATPVSSQAMPFVLPIRTEGYAPDPRNKVFAVVMTSVLYLAALVGLMLHRPVEITPAPPPRPLVVMLLPLARLPAPAHEPEHRPRPAPEKTVRSQPTPKIPVAPPQPSIRSVSLPVAPMIAPTVVLPSNPAPATPAVSAPVAPQTTAASAPVRDAPGEAKDSWEGRVLARLERFKRYPSAARSRREQGVATIRFRLDRQGRVLSSSIVQSSGNATLDQEALATLARAEPLPPIPADRPDEVELVVPIEFSLHHL